MKKKSSYEKAVRRCIRKQPMPRSLERSFRARGMTDGLEMVYTRTAQLLAENSTAPKALFSHLEQILPCIAFYETLLETTGSKPQALQLFDELAFTDIKAAAVKIKMLAALPGMYRRVPGIFDTMIDRLFGVDAGFVCSRVPNAPGFARDMTVCPYAEICRRYGCFELTQFFCKSDDITYGSMHPKLVWARTKTIGRGDDRCDFRLYVKDVGTEGGR